jgi:hypothetical protein
LQQLFEQVVKFRIGMVSVQGKAKPAANEKY